jgi:hypothetical protein
LPRNHLLVVPYLVGVKHAPGQKQLAVDIRQLFLAQQTVFRRMLRRLFSRSYLFVGIYRYLR